MAWSDLNPYPFIGLFLAISVLAYTKPPNERPIAAKAGKNKSRTEAIEAAEKILPTVSLEDDLPYLYAVFVLPGPDYWSDACG